ncbi:MAG TPA: hypothetical protein VFT29_09800 [Gemmatimonadaceae bacterium]|nr:hypothetical protein [Gemmatimonadaceae bacterium]
MYSTCLFCFARLGSNAEVESFPVGRCLAFDSARGRLWVVCTACGRWNLTPLEERWEAIDVCERLFRQSRTRITTAEIGLARLPDGAKLVRIGAPLRPEFAAWRYGARFTRRRKQTRLLAASIAVAAGGSAIAAAPVLFPTFMFGTAALLAFPGFTTLFGTLPVVGALAVRDYFENERVVGRVAHHDRMIVVRAKHARSTQLHVGRGEHVSVALDVQHDGGWTHLDGFEAMQAASILLAGANRFGAPASQVAEAVQRVEAEGDAPGYLRAASTLGGARNGRFISLLNRWRGIDALHLSSTECLALEMVLHEEAERRALEGELALLEAAWRDAEDIARVADAL